MEKRSKMIRVDEAFMNEVGLAEMAEPEKQAFMEEAEAELELRVGEAMAERLSKDEVDEFSKIAEDDAALVWLNAKVPDFRDLVRETFRQFKEEIRAERAQILG